MTGRDKNQRNVPSDRRKAPAPQPRQEGQEPTTNPRLTEQSRKILGKHDANRSGKR